MGSLKDYLNNHKKRNNKVRSSEEIQKVFEITKHIVPDDLIEQPQPFQQVVVIKIKSHEEMERRTETVMKFIRGEK